MRCCPARRYIDEERGLADARLAVQQRDRAGDEPTGQDAIEFADASAPRLGLADPAARSNAHSIVLPPHGRTGLTRLLIGSVAERGVRLSHCPVLVLRS